MSLFFLQDLLKSRSSLHPSEEHLSADGWRLKSLQTFWAFLRICKNIIALGIENHKTSTHFLVLMVDVAVLIDFVIEKETFAQGLNANRKLAWHLQNDRTSYPVVLAIEASN